MLSNISSFTEYTRGCYEMIKKLREWVRAQLERMKELCKERNSLYEKQNDLKGQKWKIEKSLEWQEMCGMTIAMPYIFVENGN